LDTARGTLWAHPSYECPTRELVHQYYRRNIQYLWKILAKVLAQLQGEFKVCSLTEGRKNVRSYYNQNQNRPNKQFQ